MAVLSPGRKSIRAAALACSLASAQFVLAPVVRVATCTLEPASDEAVLDRARPEGAGVGTPAPDDAVSGQAGCGPQVDAPPLWALGLLALGLGAALRTRERLP